MLLLPSLLNDVLLTDHRAVADEGTTDVATDWVDAVTTGCAVKGPCNCVEVDLVKVDAVSWVAVLVGD